MAEFWIIVCGGRSYNDPNRVGQVLWGLEDARGRLCIRHGACPPDKDGNPGADELADRWCTINDHTVDPCFAEWTRYGPAAGPIRNAAMLVKLPKVELVVAFPGGDGTADMVRRARKAGVEVMEVR